MKDVEAWVVSLPFLTNLTGMQYFFAEVNLYSKTASRNSDVLDSDC